MLLMGTLLSMHLRIIMGKLCRYDELCHRHSRPFPCEFYFKRPSNRAQRASARNLNQSVTTGPLLHPQDMDASSSHTGQDLEPSLLGDDDARSSDSRSASLQLVGSSSLPNLSEMNGQRSNVREMGKGRTDKESEKVNMRVKEEPAAVHLSDIPAAPVSNSPFSFIPSTYAE